MRAATIRADDTDEVREIVRVEQIMGLPVSVRVRHFAGPAELDRLDALVRNVFGYLRRVDEVFSTWRNDSELMRLRRGELDRLDAHPWIAEVRELSARAVAVTGGLFCDQLTGPDGSSGWDPTGIVKGWAVDRAVNHLRTAPALTFAVGAGGDIVCGTGRGVAQQSPLARPWQIGIEDPDRPGRLLGSLPIAWGAAATSGTAARGAHIVDPRTALPTTRRGSVTVTGPDLTWADVWATACFLDPAALDRSPSSLAQGYRLCLDHTSDSRTQPRQEASGSSSLAVDSIQSTSTSESISPPDSGSARRISSADPEPTSALISSAITGETTSPLWSINH